jgi:hypothetical protein
MIRCAYETLCTIRSSNKTGKVKFRSVRVNIFAVEKQYYECVYVALVIQHAKRILRIILSSVASRALAHFYVSHKEHGFWENVIERKMCVFIFPTHFI